MGLFMNVNTATRTLDSLLELAQAALDDDTKRFRIRAMELDRVASQDGLAELPMPNETDSRILCLCAAIVELLAERYGYRSPLWTDSIGALDQPLLLIPSMRGYPDSIKAMLAETPEPLRKRNLIATRSFLNYAV
jgi:hypothetical protein